MIIGFDIISDLHLSPQDSFNWENKATSLYCLVAGNVSSDLRTLTLTLAHLSKFYQGIFFIPGYLEYENAENLQARLDEITLICSRIKNVVHLHHHVIIVDGIAILGSNGWFETNIPENLGIANDREMMRYDDIFYLKNSIEKLQKHLDVTKIVVLTNSVPNLDLCFGEGPDIMKHHPQMSICLAADLMKKVSHWIYGSYGKIVDITNDNINYICNPYYGKKPYYAKRIDIEI